MSEPGIRVRGLRRSYPSGGKRLDVLKGLSLDVEIGEMVAVVGESGAGKSTLLHLLGGLDSPDAGSIVLSGAEIASLSAFERAAFRSREVGYVFQFHHLLPEFSAEENALMPCLIRREPMQEARRKARALLDELGLLDRAGHRPSELSGGEQQRVAIARALVGSPTVLLADEPTGNLDYRTSESVFTLIREAVARRCDRLYVMEDGVLRDLPGSRYKFGLETPAVQI